MKRMKVREPKKDWSAYTTEQEANLESSHTTTKSSTLRVVRTEVIGGRKYNVLTVGWNCDIIWRVSGSTAVRALGADTKINLNPIERIIGEHDLAKLEGGTAARKCRCSLLFVYAVERVRVLAFYMRANNGGKVSNLTVGHHQFIPLTNTEQQGAPFLASFALPHRGYLNN